MPPAAHERSLAPFGITTGPRFPGLRPLLARLETQRMTFRGKRFVCISGVPGTTPDSRDPALIPPSIQSGWPPRFDDSLRNCKSNSLGDGEVLDRRRVPVVEAGSLQSVDAVTAVRVAERVEAVGVGNVAGDRALVSPLERPRRAEPSSTSSWRRQCGLRTTQTPHPNRIQGVLGPTPRIRIPRRSNAPGSSLQNTATGRGQTPPLLCDTGLLVTSRGDLLPDPLAR